MSFLGRVKPGPGGKTPSANAGFFASEVESAARTHYESLGDALTRSSDEERLAAFQELLRAHYCLASGCAYQTIKDIERAQLFAVEVLTALQEHTVLPGIAQSAFAPAALEESIGCYINGVLTDDDRRAVEVLKRVLRVPQDNWLLGFAVLLHVRLMRVIGIRQNSSDYLGNWAVTCEVLSGSYEALAALEPLVSE